MRKKIAKALAGAFSEAFLRKYPNFKSFPSPHKDMVVFMQPIKRKIAAFVVVVLSDDEHDDAFTLEVAFSTTGRLPWDADQVKWRPEGEPPLVRGGLNIRIGFFLQPARDVWWALPKGATGDDLTAIFRLISEAVEASDKGIEYALRRAREKAAT